MPTRPRVTRPLAVAALTLLAWPAATLAQPDLPDAILVPQSSEFAAVRARFEGMTEAQVQAAGYELDPHCVTAVDAGLPPAVGGMGFHAVHPQRFAEQFPSGQLDPQNPPLLLLDANKRVVGLEWEAAATLPQPALFGQTVPLLPGHPGPAEVNVPHYMLHAYFKPNGMVLFSVFDPELTCPAAAAPAAQPKPGAPAPKPAPGMPAPAAKPAAPAPAPAQAPRALPRTGEAENWLIGGLAIAGAVLLSAGLVVRRRGV